MRLQQLARVSNELGAADTMDDVIEAAVRHAARAIGASVSTLMVTEGDRLRLLAGEGLRDGVLERWSSFGLDDRNPASEAARTGRPVVLGSPPLVESAYPVLRDEMPEGRSLMCLPLDSSQPSVGVIGLTFEAGWLPGPNEMDFLTAYADACGQAVRRVAAGAVAQARAKRLTFLAQVSQELSSSLDDRATLTNVANLIVPELADWCAVSVSHDGALRTVAVAHQDPDMVQWAWELQDRYPTDPDAPAGAPHVIRTGVSELYPEISDDMLAAGARDEEHLRIARELDLRSALVVPLAARGRTLGSITMIRTSDRSPYDDSDLAFAEDLGRRAGVAIDNAQLYAQTQDVALQLQRAVLPEALDNISGWEIATYYAPGGRGGVGGDFYDAIALPDGALAFVIGDVMGHGVPAAAAMAQLRSAVRAYLCIDPEPAAVARKLDVMFAELGITQLATLVYGVVDTGSGRASFVNAGHFPPVLVRPGEPPSYVQTSPRLPLGAGGDERTSTTIDFGGRDTLLLFTDGLVEHRGEVIDTGLNRLAALAHRLSEGPLQEQLDGIVAALSDDARGDDDTTAFALRQCAGR
ncbi:MAG TPA: SpoIIE family protein phosphatase [Jatrophihabitantaceae bacterium]